MEILTITDLAALLKMSKKQIYTMCETRTRNGAMKDHPLPVFEDQWQPALPSEGMLIHGLQGWERGKPRDPHRFV